MKDSNDLPQWSKGSGISNSRKLRLVTESESIFEDSNIEGESFTTI